MASTIVVLILSVKFTLRHNGLKALILRVLLKRFMDFQFVLDVVEGSVECVEHERVVFYYVMQ